MFWHVKSPLVASDEDWQIACWQWLLENFGGLSAFREHKLILPNKSFFPPTKLDGHERALHIFYTVAKHMGLSSVDFDLISQEAPVDPVLDGLMVVKNAPVSPAGTFHANADGKPRITYNPNSIDKPLELVATLCHELCHALLLSTPDLPPGGAELEECATDLAMTFFGFGIFGANDAFEFKQYHDSGSGMQGWSTRHMGYLSEAEWGFSLAVFASLRERGGDDLVKYLDETPCYHMKKTMKYLEKHPEVLRNLQAGTS